MLILKHIIMGTYNSTYLGVYLEVPYLKSTVTEKHYVNPENGNKQKNRFDANTGRENELREFTREEYITPYSYIVDVEGLREDEFATPAYTNGGKRIQTFILSGTNEFSFCGSDLFNFDISSIDIPKLLEEFKIKYKAYLDYYVEQYGVITVKYGVVNYAH